MQRPSSCNCRRSPKSAATMRRSRDIGSFENVVASQVRQDEGVVGAFPELDLRSKVESPVGAPILREDEASSRIAGPTAHAVRRAGGVRDADAIGMAGPEPLQRVPGRSGVDRRDACGDEPRGRMDVRVYSVRELLFRGGDADACPDLKCVPLSKVQFGHRLVWGCSLRSHASWRRAAMPRPRL